MSKRAADKIAEGLTEIRDKLRGDYIEPSCGCVFCDLDLKPEMIDGKPQHRVPKRFRDVGHEWVECEKTS